MDGAASAANSRSNSQMPSRAQSPDRADHDLPAQEQHASIAAVKAVMTQEDLHEDAQKHDVSMSNARAPTSHEQADSILPTAMYSSETDASGSFAHSSRHSSPPLSIANTTSFSPSKSSAQAAQPSTAAVVASSHGSPEHQRVIASNGTPVPPTVTHVPQHDLQQSSNRLNTFGKQTAQSSPDTYLGSPQASPSSKHENMDSSTAGAQKHSVLSASASSSQSHSLLQSLQVHDTASSQHTWEQQQDRRHLSSHQEQTAMQTQANKEPLNQRHTAFSTTTNLASDADSAAVIPSLVLRDNQEPNVDKFAKQNASSAGKSSPMLSPPVSDVAGRGSPGSPATTVPAKSASSAASIHRGDSATCSASSLRQGAKDSTAQESPRTASAEFSIQEEGNFSPGKCATASSATASSTASLLTDEVLSPGTEVQHSHTAALGDGEPAASPQHPLARSALCAEPNLDRSMIAHLQPTLAQVSPAESASITDSLSQSPQAQVSDSGVWAQNPFTHAHPLNAEHAPAAVEQLHAAMDDAEHSEDAASLSMSASSSHSSTRQKHGVHMHASESSPADLSTEGTASPTISPRLNSSGRTQVKGHKSAATVPACMFVCSLYMFIEAIEGVLWFQTCTRTRGVRQYSP